MYYIRVQATVLMVTQPPPVAMQRTNVVDKTTGNPTFIFRLMIVDPRYEDEAISALMEEALSEDSDEQKFDLDTYLNGDFDYA